MPEPKSGTPGSLVSPTAPKAPEEADVADPGEMNEIKAEQAEKKEGKYGSQPIEPFKAGDDEDTSWIEIELVDEDDRPVPGEAYRITLSDGRVASGTLDSEGKARVEGIPAGDCQVTFQNLDSEAWEMI